jgi:hypothetical protein
MNENTLPLELPYNCMWRDNSYWLGRVLSGSKVQASFLYSSLDTIENYSLTFDEQ